jgi:hypothetical protein
MIRRPPSRFVPRVGLVVDSASLTLLRASNRHREVRTGSVFLYDPSNSASDCRFNLPP